ncbi:hypothetical protein [Mammaliicoccus sp. E-M21]|uniref:hypothetical protein n=1 Tax=Mammaliicoccus sp. E-M21 TaxID=2898681 RepID=UPI001EFB760F|nr:hypothetical protein [Mammaliicoccus sp. E-M21]
MNKIKKRSGFLVVILILSITLAACGSIKEDVQGKWESVDHTNLILDIKDDNVEGTYTEKTEGTTNKKIVKGKLLEEKDDYIELKMEGITKKGKLVPKDDKLMFDELEFKKVD